MTPFCSPFLHTALYPGECTRHFGPDTGHSGPPLPSCLLRGVISPDQHETDQTSLMKWSGFTSRKLQRACRPHMTGGSRVQDKKKTRRSYENALGEDNKVAVDRSGTDTEEARESQEPHLKTKKNNVNRSEVEKARDTHPCTPNTPDLRSDLRPPSHHRSNMVKLQRKRRRHNCGA
ncbi:hypothetical protein WMY93_025367 [Mugilogobius chulae]|uniref:Uncharacterized protein n=1 Tax=Mugilogobius chulae TaxID=88201 RepID=A0AAW0NC76_9GOBI